MKIAVLGTGVVGNAIKSKLVALGHDVRMGSRSATNTKATDWVKKTGTKASQWTFADAAAFWRDPLQLHQRRRFARGAEGRRGREPQRQDRHRRVQPARPLERISADISFRGNDPTGEQLQSAFPDAKVVKALSTVNCQIIVDPGRVKGDHDIFVNGNDAAAKAQVTEISRDWFGWRRVVDLGDITRSRGVESYIVTWVHLYGAIGTSDFNIKVVRWRPLLDG